MKKITIGIIGVVSLLILMGVAYNSGNNTFLNISYALPLTFIITLWAYPLDKSKTRTIAIALILVAGLNSFMGAMSPGATTAILVKLFFFIVILEFICVLFWNFVFKGMLK